MGREGVKFFTQVPQGINTSANHPHIAFSYIKSILCIIPTGSLFAKNSTWLITNKQTTSFHSYYNTATQKHLQEEYTNGFSFHFQLINSGNSLRSVEFQGFQTRATTTTTELVVTMQETRENSFVLHFWFVQFVKYLWVKGRKGGRYGFQALTLCTEWC